MRIGSDLARNLIIDNYQNITQVYISSKKYVLFSPRSLGKWSNFDLRIFFNWLGSTTNYSRKLSFLQPRCFVNHLCISQWPAVPIISWAWHLSILFFSGNCQNCQPVNCKWAKWGQWSVEDSVFENCLGPNWPLFLKVNPPKQGPKGPNSNQNSRVIWVQNGGFNKKDPCVGIKKLQIS